MVAGFDLDVEVLCSRVCAAMRPQDGTLGRDMTRLHSITVVWMIRRKRTWRGRVTFKKVKLIAWTFHNYFTLSAVSA